MWTDNLKCRRQSNTNNLSDFIFSYWYIDKQKEEYKYNHGSTWYTLVDNEASGPLDP